MPTPTVPPPAPATRVTPTLPPIPETALITAWARAAESRRADAVLHDPAAERLLDHVAYDTARFAGAWKSQIGVAVRGAHFDAVVTRFLRDAPTGRIVTLGAGLDTRFERIDNGRATWVDVDLAPMITIREHLFPAHPRRHPVAADLTDPAAVTAALAEPAGAARPTIVLAEGVAMFLPPPTVAPLIRALGTVAPGAALHVDVIGGVMVWCPWLHDSLSRVADGTVRFAWGVRSPRALSRRCGGAAVASWTNLLDHAPDRWRWMRWLRSVPVMHRQFVAATVRLPGLPRTTLNRGATVLP